MWKKPFNSHFMFPIQYFVHNNATPPDTQGYV